MTVTRCWVASAVVLAAAVLAGIAVLTGDEVVPGTAVGRPDDHLARTILANCRADEPAIDPGSLRPGPVLRTESGEYLVVATAPNGMLVDCTTHGFAGTAGPYPKPDGVKAMLAATIGSQGSNFFIGYGWVTPDVARVDVVLPDGQVITTQVVDEVFAFSATGRYPGMTVTVRACDAANKLIYERPPPG